MNQLSAPFAVWENAIKVYHALRDIFSGPIVPRDAIFIPLRSVQVDECKYLIFIMSLYVFILK